MNNKNTSTTNSTTTRNNLTYIESLISGATRQGLYSIVVPNNRIDDNMADEIRTYGYNVFKKNSFLGENYDYVISWSSSPTGQTTTEMMVQNNSIDLRILLIKINDVDITHIGGSNFVLYTSEGGRFSTDESGNVTISITLETGSIVPNQTIQIRDSDNVVHCHTVSDNFSGIITFNNVVVNGQELSISADMGTC